MQITARRRTATLLALSLAFGVASVFVAPPASAASTFLFEIQPVSEVIAGGTADLRLRIENAGPDPAEEPSIEISLPAGLTLTGFGDSCSDSATAPQLSCTVWSPFIDMPSGAADFIDFRVEIDPDFVLDNGAGTSSANALISYQIDFVGGAQSGSRRAIVGERSDLRVRKYANPPVAEAGQTVLYSIDVDNLGPSTARNVVIRDTLFSELYSGLPPILIQGCAFSVSQGGGVITQFSCATGPNSAVQFGNVIGTMSTDALQPVGLYPAPNPGDPDIVGGRLRASFTLTSTEAMTMANEVRVFSDTADPDNGNNLAVATNTVTAVADLGVTIAPASPTAIAGDLITYTQTVTNHGPSTAEDVSVATRLPAGVQFVSATPSAGTCLSGTPGDPDDPLICLLGTMARPTAVDPVEPATETITITVRVAPHTEPGTAVVARAWVTSNVADVNNTNDGAEALVTIADTPFLFNPITPVRQFDTRDGTGGVPVGKVAGLTALEFTVTGVNGIPAGATAVTLNVTVEGPEGDGFLTAYPCASPLPLASNLNYLAGQVVANAVIAPVDPTGKVCFFTKATANIISDVSGWIRPAPGLNAVTPVRVLDTRDGIGPVPVQKVAAGSVVTVKLAGSNGLPPTGVGAAVLNVTAVNPEDAGHLTVFPCGPVPASSTLNFVAGQIVPNMVITPVSAQGTICVYAHTTTDVIADLSAWMPTTSEYHPVNPARLFDTRTGAGGVPVRRLPAGEEIEITVTGRNTVPNSGVGSVVLNLIATGPAGDGYLTAFPCGSRPPTSSVNFRAGQTVANAVITPISPTGTVCVYTNVETNIVGDISGWFPGA